MYNSNCTSQTLYGLGCTTLVKNNCTSLVSSSATYPSFAAEFDISNVNTQILPIDAAQSAALKAKIDAAIALAASLPINNLKIVDTMPV